MNNLDGSRCRAESKNRIPTPFKNRAKAWAVTDQKKHLSGLEIPITEEEGKHLSTLSLPDKFWFDLRAYVTKTGLTKELTGKSGHIPPDVAGVILAIRVLCEHPVGIKNPAKYAMAAVKAWKDKSGLLHNINKVGVLSGRDRLLSDLFEADSVRVTSANRSKWEARSEIIREAIALKKAIKDGTVPPTDISAITIHPEPQPPIQAPCEKPLDDDTFMMTDAFAGYDDRLETL